MEAYQGKKKARMKFGQEPRKAEIKTDLEEMNATELEAIQEKPEALKEHQEVPNEEAALETIVAWRTDLGTSNRS